MNQKCPFCGVPLQCVPIPGGSHLDRMPHTFDTMSQGQLIATDCTDFDGPLLHTLLAFLGGE